MYSTVKRIVMPHSIALRKGPYWAWMLATLSRQTAKMLTTIATSRATSNALPAGVSASKMISWMRSRREDVRVELADMIYHCILRVRSHAGSGTPRSTDRDDIECGQQIPR